MTDQTIFISLFALGVVLELTVPLAAERQGKTPWHRHHMIERYGLLNIIVLGETLLAASMALAKLDFDAWNVDLFRVALCSVVLLGAMWWLYFSREEHLAGSDLHRVFTWGYGHFLIYAAGGAVGAGLALLVDVVNHDAHISVAAARLAVALPMSLYWLGLWLVRDRYVLRDHGYLVLPTMALLLPVLGWYLPLEALAAAAVLSVYLRSSICRRNYPECVEQGAVQAAARE